MSTAVADPSTVVVPAVDTAAADASACVPCAHAAKAGWWGPDLAPARTHHPPCHRSWRSRLEAHCPSCCAHFCTPGAADAHRLPGGGCMDPATARRKDGKLRFVARETQFGVSWRVAFYGKRPAHWGDARAEDGSDS